MTTPAHGRGRRSRQSRERRAGGECSAATPRRGSDVTCTEDEPEPSRQDQPRRLISSTNPASAPQHDRQMTSIFARLKPDLAPFKHSRDFRLLYIGQAGSSAGAMICYVALPYQAYRISHSSLVVGLLSVAELLPVLLAGLIGGTLADALERRRLILITQLVCVTCAAVPGRERSVLAAALAALRAGWPASRSVRNPAAFGRGARSAAGRRTTTCRRRRRSPVSSARSPRPAGRYWPASC